MPEENTGNSRLFLRKRLLVILSARSPDFHCASPSRFQWLVLKQFFGVIYSCGDSPRITRDSLFQKCCEDNAFVGRRQILQIKICRTGFSDSDRFPPANEWAGRRFLHIHCLVFCPEFGLSHYPEAEYQECL